MTNSASNFSYSRFWYKPEFLVLFIPAAIKLFIHLLAINGYGIHGDELYYLACSNHLDWGYVDQPPLSILLLHLERLLFGDSAFSIRLLAALAGSATVLLTGLITRRLGGGLHAQLLAGLCALVAPVYLGINHYYSMNAFEPLFWLAAAYLLLRIIDEEKPELWLAFGLVAGLAFENKIGVLFLGFGMLSGLLITKQRKLLFNRWALLGGLIAFCLMLPYIIWNWLHGWPTLEWIANARAFKMVALSPLAFIKEQILLMQPFTVLIWGTGLAAMLFNSLFRRYRIFGWCYLIVLAVFIVQGAKAYYLTPIYPFLFAAGAIIMERWLRRPWQRWTTACMLVVMGALTAPMGLPLLPVQSFIKYQDAIGVRPSSGEKWAEGKLPSFYANFFGWKELAAQVDSVYHSLPAEDQARCCIFGQNYMQAGAIDFYGAKSGLHALAGLNSYWLWGFGKCTGEVMIIMGSNYQDLKNYFEEVEEKARFRNEYIQPMHSNIPIFVVHRPKQPLSQIWPKVKSYM